MKSPTTLLAGSKPAPGELSSSRHRSAPGPSFVPAVGIALLFAASIAGCASWRQKFAEPGISQNREERAAEVIREFEDRRDTAQLAAALERFEQGDIDRAETMLTSVVNRRPDLSEARLRLAEILGSRNDPAAETHLRAVLENDSKSAEAHHALGLLLEATDRIAEARQHFLRATEIEPDNEIYRQTAESLTVSESSR
jgi:Tfp pilus assembly protein PilF